MHHLLLLVLWAEERVRKIGLDDLGGLFQH